MRRRLVYGIGVGLAGVLTGSAVAQFAADRVPTSPPAPAATPPAGAPAPAPTPPPGFPPVLPVSPGRAVTPAGGVPPAYVPPPGGLLPAGYSAVPPAGEPRPVAAPPPVNLEVRGALPADHPWALKAEHGAYFICVKSYSRPGRATEDDKGPSALEMAEALAGEIRDLYRVQAFLFEYVSEERKAEMAAIAAARARGQEFATQLDKYRQQSQLNGMEFLSPDTRMRFKTVNYRDQIAVLVGGFKTDEDARKALDKVKAWPAPRTKVRSSRDPDRRETSLMDWGAVVRPGPDGKPMLEQSHINPYTTATVVPSPAIPHGPQTAAPECDPFIVKLNEGRPYSLLKATKGWTLAVKSFNAPVQIVGRDGGNDVMRKVGTSKAADVLAAGAEQAESLAKALRELKGPGGQPLGLEAFVLHTRNASLVTIGQFDGPADDALLQTKQLLSGMRMNVTEDKTGMKPVANAPSLFGNVMAIPIPHP